MIRRLALGVLLLASGPTDLPSHAKNIEPVSLDGGMRRAADEAVLRRYLAQHYHWTSSPRGRMILVGRCTSPEVGRPVDRLLLSRLPTDQGPPLSLRPYRGLSSIAACSPGYTCHIFCLGELDREGPGRLSIAALEWDIPRSEQVAGTRYELRFFLARRSGHWTAWGPRVEAVEETELRAPAGRWWGNRPERESPATQPWLDTASTPPRRSPQALAAWEALAREAALHVFPFAGSRNAGRKPTTLLVDGGACPATTVPATWDFVHRLKNLPYELLPATRERLRACRDDEDRRCLHVGAGPVIWESSKRVRVRRFSHGVRKDGRLGAVFDTLLERQGREWRILRDRLVWGQWTGWPPPTCPPDTPHPLHGKP